MTILQHLSSYLPQKGFSLSLSLSLELSLELSRALSLELSLSLSGYEWSSDGIYSEETHPVDLNICTQELSIISSRVNKPMTCNAEGQGSNACFVVFDC